MAGVVPPTASLLGDAATTSVNKLVEVQKKVDYMSLPCPIPYEELHREAMSSFFLSFSPLSICVFVVYMWLFLCSMMPRICFCLFA